jgi:hypothetical protein
MAKKNTIKKVEILNTAAKQIRESLLAIDLMYSKDPDINVYIWRASKAFAALLSATCKKLDKEVTDEAFKDIIKDLGDVK